MLESTSASGENREVMFCMGALVLSALSVWFYTSVELFSSSFGSSSTREAETTGTTGRKSLLIAISLASFARVASVVTLCVSYYHSVAVPSVGSAKWLEMLRVLPTCAYITVYTMVTVHFAQMCHTVSLNSGWFIQLRNIFIAANVLMYSLIVFFVSLYLVATLVDWVFLVSFAVILLSTLFYGYSLFKLLPGSTAHHQLTARRVMARFVPLLVICVVGLSFGAVYYLLLVLNLLPSDVTASKQFVYDFIAFTFSEVLPTLLIILLISKKPNTAAVGEGTGLVAETSGDLLHVIKGYISSKYSAVPGTEPAAAVTRV